MMIPLFRSVLLLAVMHSASGAQAPVSRGTFVVALGVDTIAIESFTRWSDRVEGVLVRRSPVTRVHHYVVRLGDGGLPRRFDDTLRLADGAAVTTGPRRFSVDFREDSAIVEVQGDSLLRRRVALAFGFPALPESYALYEIWLASLRARGVDSAAVGLVGPAGGPAGRLPVRLVSPDSARAWILGAPLRMLTDAAGRLLALDGTATTLKYEVTRVEHTDLGGIAASFAARDAAGRSLGLWVSPRDTTRATVGRATVIIDYGRPAARGRDVFRRGVLGDTLWRTGANAATQLEVSQDVEIGGRPLPAGKYTLWTRVAPDNSGYELVVNSQTGQWGTQHDPARDLFRVPLRADPLAQGVDLFTIAVVPSGPAAAALVLRWDRTQLSTPIRTR
ncbi:MAG TPA: DUF2911 domain-containing protein [Gemmatimonadaceae bacterium]|nr:DUF2911 domain-containing protein [Gemmatimonadaceae bacterium]